MQVAHPILEQAALSLDQQDGEFFADRAKAMLQKIEDGKELTDAVLSVVSLAKIFDDAGQVERADRLIDIACSVTDRLKDFGSNARKLAEDMTRMKTQRLRRFEGDAGPKRAPRFGAKGNGVSLKSLIPPRPRRA